ncbi:hypothetical protein ABZ801_15920 [Actinomadura sp. NPDC047616]|uniref:hypothetical protein n=1 Tax=Actinomadura sp. NPDC047616 TaxID=3155914 RepID=UPI0033CEAE95
MTATVIDMRTRAVISPGAPAEFDAVASSAAVPFRFQQALAVGPDSFTQIMRGVPVTVTLADIGTRSPRAVFAAWVGVLAARDLAAEQVRAEADTPLFATQMALPAPVKRLMWQQDGVTVVVLAMARRRLARPVPVRGWAS